MLQPVVPDRRDEDDAEFVSADHSRSKNADRHSPSAILEIEAESGFYSTPGTRRLDQLTTPDECIQMISDPAHLPTIAFIRRLCMEHGKFIAFVPRKLKSMLQERYAQGNCILGENHIIEERRSLLRALLSHIGFADPNPEPEAMPDDWDLTTKLTGGDENCAPFFASVWHLERNVGALRIVGKTDQGVILEPTEKLFNFSGDLEEDQAVA